MKQDATYKRSQNQARICSQVVFTIAKSAMQNRWPIDRELSKYFRTHKKYGSSDRRFISNTLFSMFRWWGWLRLLCNDDDIWAKDEKNVASRSDWLTVLLTANLLDAEELHPAAVTWKDSLGKLRKFPKHIAGMRSQSLPDKAQSLRNLYGLKAIEAKQLVPTWFLKESNIKNRPMNQLVALLQTRPPLWLRLQCKNRSQTLEALSHEGLQLRQTDILPDAVAVENERINVYEVTEFKSGKVEIQDFASQIIGHVCDARPGERWWDVCAGAGGKSLQLASMMKNRGTVIATDIREWKLADLRRRAKRSRFSNISPRKYSGSGMPTRAANIDGVLVDAPCSCSGTWRRNPDARWTFPEADLKSLASIQGDILRNAAKAVKPGGKLVYATCSFCPCENEEVINSFLKNHINFELDTFKDPVTGKFCAGIVKIMPNVVDSDAAFVCRMRKK